MREATRSKRLKLTPESPFKTYTASSNNVTNMLNLMSAHSSMRPLLVRVGFVLANLTEAENSARNHIAEAALSCPDAGPGSYAFYDAFLNLGFRAPLAYESPRGCYFTRATDEKLYDKRVSHLLHSSGVEKIMAHARCETCEDLRGRHFAPAILLVLSHLCYSACMLVHLWALQQ